MPNLFENTTLPGYWAKWINLSQSQTIDQTTKHRGYGSKKNPTNKIMNSGCLNPEIPRANYKKMKVKIQLKMYKYCWTSNDSPPNNHQTHSEEEKCGHKTVKYRHICLIWQNSALPGTTWMFLGSPLRLA